MSLRLCGERHARGDGRRKPASVVVGQHVRSFRRAARSGLVHLRGLFPVLVERGQGGFVLVQLGLELFDFRAVAEDFGVGEELVQFLDAGFALGDFGFDVGGLAVGEFAFAAVFRWLGAAASTGGAPGAGLLPADDGHCGAGFAGEALLDEVQVGVVVAVDDAEAARLDDRAASWRPD